MPDDGAIRDIEWRGPRDSNNRPIRNPHFASEGDRRKYRDLYDRYDSGDSDALVDHWQGDDD